MLPGVWLATIFWFSPQTQKTMTYHPKSSMSTPTPALGNEPAPDAQRDAIHQAIIPAVAGQTLAPGMRVQIIEGLAYPTVAGRPNGVVDPFLTGIVPEGDRFWLCLFPGTVTGMRHLTPSPVIQKKISEQWLQGFADQAGLEYGEMMEAAKDFLDTGEHFIQRGSQAARDAFYEGTPFWDHFEIVTGLKVPADDKGISPFCCSC